LNSSEDDIFSLKKINRELENILGEVQEGLTSKENEIQRLKENLSGVEKNSFFLKEKNEEFI
jgi:hypothetical protein